MDLRSFHFGIPRISETQTVGSACLPFMLRWGSGRSAHIDLLICNIALIILGIICYVVAYFVWLFAIFFMGAAQLGFVIMYVSTFPYIAIQLCYWARSRSTLTVASKSLLSFYPIYTATTSICSSWGMKEAVFHPTTKVSHQRICTDNA